MHTTTNPIFTGSLAIREIHGRNGPFKVGTLHTPIGEFAIKDSLLDQYDEGKYQGEFQIESIYQGHYISGGRSVTEIRAKLADMSIDDIDAEVPAPIEVEPDPIDTDKPQPAKEAKTDAESESNSNKNTENDDDSLFGLIMPLGDSVKLDPSVDRKVLRAQTVRLKEVGYEFDAKSQTWKKPSIH